MVHAGENLMIGRMRSYNDVINNVLENLETLGL